ncbi:MAG: hypothetical protein HOC74_10210 [Gemmatimonadetes bacterium]|jgi:hypothetical protein|nr:hypothetical protein [Gemmatimonadota bacterium]
MPSYRRTAREVALEIMYQPEFREVLLGPLSPRERQRVLWNLRRMRQAQRREMAR